MIRDRIGNISISEDLFTDKDTDVLLRVFSEIIILKADHNYAKQRFDYIALSKQFDEIKPGEEVPTYAALIDTIEDKVLFRRCK